MWKVIERLGGRKVIFGLLLVAVGTTVELLMTGGISTNLVDLLKFLGVSFFLGNGVEHVAKSIVAKKGPEAGNVLPEDVRATADLLSKQINDINVQLISVRDGMEQLSIATNVSQKALAELLNAQIKR